MSYHQARRTSLNRSSLRHYATSTVRLDDFWFIDQRNMSGALPLPKQTLTGASVVPLRYNLNTGTCRRRFHFVFFFFFF